MIVDWQPIATGPKEPDPLYHPYSGPVVWVWMPYDEPDTDIGWWCIELKCWRYFGDDGAYDMSPSHWAPLPIPTNAPGLDNDLTTNGTLGYA